MITVENQNIPKKTVKSKCIWIDVVTPVLNAYIANQNRE